MPLATSFNFNQYNYTQKPFQTPQKNNKYPPDNLYHKNSQFLNLIDDKWALNNNLIGLSTYNKPGKMFIESYENYMPLNQLRPTSDSWRIKSRIVKKSDLRNWKNEEGVGTVFSINLLDHKGNEIVASFYDDKHFFEVLEVGKVTFF